jgi:ferritin-like metal-binding protein YciE
MTLETLRELFVEQLRDTYSAEKQLVKALPKVADSVNSPALISAFNAHLSETMKHVSRLESVFAIAGEEPKAKVCKGMQGLIKEGEEAIGASGDEAVVDAGIIAAAQRIEHYEIAAYECLVRYASAMGLTDAVTLLEQSLKEERAAERKLMHVNDTEVMVSAAETVSATEMAATAHRGTHAQV